VPVPDDEPAGLSRSSSGDQALRVVGVVNYVSETLTEIAQPWSSLRLTARASIWLKKHSNLKSNEIARKGGVEFGNLTYIEGDPNCNIYKGISQHEV
jgi:hypothetical protein